MAVTRLALTAVAAVGILIAGYFAVSAVTESQPQNPCAGVSDQECERLIGEARGEWEARYTAWLEHIQREPSFDAQALPRIPFEGQYAPAKPDLLTAVREADVIIVGEVKSVRFIPFVNAQVTIGVEQAIKGQAGHEIDVLQAGQVVPEPGSPDPWKISSLMYSEAAPLLFPGDRALVFIERDPSGSYSVQSFTGHYPLDAQGRLSALPGNPFATVADGKPLEQFITAIEQALAQQAQP